MSSPPVQMKAIDPDGEIVDLGEESDDYDDDFGDEEEEEEEEEEEIGEEDDQGDDEEDDDYEEDYEEEAGSGGLTALLLGNEDNGDGEEEEEGQDQEYVEATIAPTPVPAKGNKRALSEPEADGEDVGPGKNGTGKKAKVL